MSPAPVSPVDPFRGPPASRGGEESGGVRGPLRAGDSSSNCSSHVPRKQDCGYSETGWHRPSVLEASISAGAARGTQEIVEQAVVPRGRDARIFEGTPREPRKVARAWVTGDDAGRGHVWKAAVDSSPSGAVNGPQQRDPLLACHFPGFPEGRGLSGPSWTCAVSRVWH